MGRAQPIAGSVRKQAERALGNKPVSSTMSSASACARVPALLVLPLTYLLKLSCTPVLDCFLWISFLFNLGFISFLTDNVAQVTRYSLHSYKFLKFILRY